MLHGDGKGQGGIIITLGSAPIMAKSFKLKLITLSSTESELLALQESTTYALWLSTLLQDLNLQQNEPIRIAQDNKSTIYIAEYGGNFSNSKHIINRQLFIAQHLHEKDISLVYCPTETMPADMLTKPLPSPTLKKLAKIISLV
jgi:ABC-type nitrate/sulfonate/bicarbonate transport system substrate-binding protein